MCKSAYSAPGGKHENEVGYCYTPTRTIPPLARTPGLSTSYPVHLCSEEEQGESSTTQVRKVTSYPLLLLNPREEPKQ